MKHAIWFYVVLFKLLRIRGEIVLVYVNWEHSIISTKTSLFVTFSGIYIMFKELIIMYYVSIKNFSSNKNHIYKQKYVNMSINI